MVVHTVTPDADDLVRVRTTPKLHGMTMAPSFAPMVQAQGRKLMLSLACMDFHPFLKTLHEREMGGPVNCGKDWAWKVIEAAVKKGAHKSATTPEALKLIAEYVGYQVKAGYAKVISWEDLCQLQPANLKVSPIAVVPQ
jgi:hypothetical protein